MYFPIVLKIEGRNRRYCMILEYDLNKEFINYNNLQAFQINNEHIQKISSRCEDKEIIIKFRNIKLEYKFNYINDERYFAETCLLDGFNRILAVAYKNDYIIRDKTGIYVLNKDKFEKYYLIG
jgi:hypothetical protein